MSILITPHPKPFSLAVPQSKAGVGIGIFKLIFGGIFTALSAWFTQAYSRVTFGGKMQYGLAVLFVGVGIACIVRALFDVAKELRLLKVQLILIGDGRVLRVQRSRKGRVVDEDMILYENIEDVMTTEKSMTTYSTKFSDINEESYEYSKRFLGVELLTKNKSIPLAFSLASDDAENLVFIIKRKLGMDR